MLNKPKGKQKTTKSDVKATLGFFSHLKKPISFFGNRKLPASKNVLKNQPENPKKSAT
jgi:hypothetical protein